MAKWNDTEHERFTENEYAYFKANNGEGGRHNKSSEILEYGAYQSGVPIRQNMYAGFSKFGYIDPYGRLTNTKEVLFFSRPDLHIMDGNELNPDLSSIPFWIELKERWPSVIRELQASYTPALNQSDIYPYGYYMTSLSNRCKSNLDLPDISATEIDLPQNMYGTDYTYRGNSESSDDKVNFNLEFEDNKNLDIYMLFKAYEEYERLKALGRVAPPGQWVSLVGDPNTSKYVRNKTLHDQICIYKFILEEDLETIIHYSKIIGVYPKTLPRSVFGNDDFSNGLSLSIDWNGAFVDDMNPIIISEFNDSMSIFKAWPDLPIVNEYGQTSRTWARGAYIKEYIDNNGRKRYKLKWKIGVRMDYGRY